MNKHTPGPWSVSPDQTGTEVFAADGQFLMSMHREADELIANARLIAAAPAMLEALEAVLLFHSAGPWDEKNRRRWKQITNIDDATTKVLCDTIRALLTRIDGGSDNKD